ncbi:hypothetical protein CONCODRAFT_161434, partial [Conidiobolus coronatus NRRL 28638]
KIDWTLILINTQIPLYLCKPSLINLSLASKLIRSKLSSLVYKNLTINDIVLSNQPNYFMDKKLLELENFGYLANIWAIGKNGFNRELAFKEVRIDSFINRVKGQLKSWAKYCKLVNFECLGNACYFLLPITLEFLNLRTLSFNMCAISLAQLNNILSKVSKLEVLALRRVDIINSPDSNSTNTIKFPNGLYSLTYINNMLSSSNLPDTKPIQFLKTNDSIDTTPSPHLSPQFLPRLSKLNYYSTTITDEFIEFLSINSQIEDLSLPITFLSSIKTNIKLLLNLKKLKLYAQSFRYEQVTADNLNIPAFPNLKELNLNLRTNTELEFAELLIKKCAKLSKLNILSSNLEYKKLKGLVKFANSLRYFNDERVSEQSTIKIQKPILPEDLFKTDQKPPFMIVHYLT